MASLFGKINEETPQFDLLKKSEQGYEIRHYHQQLRATVEVSNANGEGNATQSGFRDLAGYIFGGNKQRAGADKAKKIAMTAPVMTEEASPEKIAMTAPVMTESNDTKSTRMSFVLPSKYKSLDDLPIPNDSKVKLEVVEPHTVAVLRFSGSWSQSSMDSQLSKLLGLLKTDQIQLTGPGRDIKPKVARYNPPWTLPFLRTNEIMVPVVFEKTSPS